MRCRLLIIGLLLLTAGCGSSSMAPVSGRVTWKGQPVANAIVTFEPISDEENPGPGSFGRTNANGEFTLVPNNGPGQGALVGRHKVRIVAYEGDDSLEQSSGAGIVHRKRLIPDEYNVNSNK